jgi:hypothetical protein
MLPWDSYTSLFKKCRQPYGSFIANINIIVIQFIVIQGVWKFVQLLGSGYTAL